MKERASLPLPRMDFSPANSLAEAVAETVGVGEPVCQGPGLWGPYFDYPGRRQVYVQWCAPPLCPRPSMYFNWSVLVPPGAAAGRKAQQPGFLHHGGHLWDTSFGVAAAFGSQVTLEEIEALEASPTGQITSPAHTAVPMFPTALLGLFMVGLLLLIGQQTVARRTPHSG